MQPLVQVFGKYYRVLSKKVQAELAEANSIAEEVLSSMTTVKAHAAEVREVVPPGDVVSCLD